MDRAAMLTLDKANAKPLHIQIEESILQKLESREWAPGRLIPRKSCIFSKKSVVVSEKMRYHEYV